MACIGSSLEKTAQSIDNVGVIVGNSGAVLNSKLERGSLTIEQFGEMLNKSIESSARKLQGESRDTRESLESQAELYRAIFEGFRAELGKVNGSIEALPDEVQAQLYTVIDGLREVIPFAKSSESCGIYAIRFDGAKGFNLFPEESNPASAELRGFGFGKLDPGSASVEILSSSGEKIANLTAKPQSDPRSIRIEGIPMLREQYSGETLWFKFTATRRGKPLHALFQLRVPAHSEYFLVVDGSLGVREVMATYNVRSLDGLGEPGNENGSNVARAFRLELDNPGRFPSLEEPEPRLVDSPQPTLSPRYMDGNPDGRIRWKERDLGAGVVAGSRTCKDNDSRVCGFVQGTVQRGRSEADLMSRVRTLWGDIRLADGADAKLSVVGERLVLNGVLGPAPSAKNTEVEVFDTNGKFLRQVNASELGLGGLPTAWTGLIRWWSWSEPSALRSTPAWIVNGKGGATPGQPNLPQSTPGVVRLRSDGVVHLHLQVPGNSLGLTRVTALSGDATIAVADYKKGAPVSEKWYSILSQAKFEFSLVRAVRRQSPSGDRYYEFRGVRDWKVDLFEPGGAIQFAPHGPPPSGDFTVLDTAVFPAGDGGVGRLRVLGRVGVSDGKDGKNRQQSEFRLEVMFTPQSTATR
jgi:hypothetical protein